MIELQNEREQELKEQLEFVEIVQAQKESTEP